MRGLLGFRILRGTIKIQLNPSLIRLAFSVKAFSLLMIL
jgi:hypothetical protein